MEEEREHACCLQREDMAATRRWPSDPQACCVQAEAVCRLPNAVARQPGPSRPSALAEPEAACSSRPPCEAADMEEILKERGACGVRARPGALHHVSELAAV